MASVAQQSSDFESGETLQDHAISEHARRCLEAFAQLSQSASLDERVIIRLPVLFRQRHDTKPLIDLTDVGDNCEQFRVWANNLGVFAADHGSLDFRLREALDVRVGIVSLLKSLQKDLSECLQVLVADRQFSLEPSGHDSDDSSSESSVSTDPDKGTSPPAKRTADELQARFSHIRDIVDKLVRLAEIIRASGVRSHAIKAESCVHFENGVNLTEQFERHFLPPFLKHRFKLEEPLLGRFVKAISLRRRRFMYQSKHQKRLAYGLEAPEGPIRRDTTPVSHDLRLESSTLKRNHTGQHETLQLASSLKPPTKATTFERLPANIPVPSRIRSASMKSGRAVIKTPPPPTAADRATHFECPYCCILVSKDKRAPKPRRGHVITDLQPFIRLEPDCPNPNTTFESKENWVEHQKWEHAMEWWCDGKHRSHAATRFRTAEEYASHLKAAHGSTLPSSSLDTQVTSVGRASLTPFSCCPLCDFLPEDMVPLNVSTTEDSVTQAISGQRQLQKHIADELLSIFLAALPDRDDVRDKDTDNDFPNDKRSTVLALSNTFLTFDEVARPDEEGLSSEAQMHATSQNPRDVSEPLPGGFSYNELWQDVWESAELQGSVRKTYNGIEDDEISKTMLALQAVSTSPTTPSTGDRGQSHTQRGLGPTQLFSDFASQYKLEGPVADQHELAMAYRQTRQVEKAVLLLEQVVTVQEQTLLEDYLARLPSQYKLAVVYRQTRQVEKAISLLEQVVKIQEQTLPEDHLDRLVALRMLAGAYRDNGQAERSILSLERVVKTREQTAADTRSYLES